MSFEQKKSLGQNFLNSDYVPKKLCDAANVLVGDTILEIGPGTGALTKELLSRGATVTAFEADTRAIAVLEETFPKEITEKRLRLHHVDARNFDLETFGFIDQQFKVVANIPYYISGLLLRTILESPIQPTDLVFLMQKELVERIARAEKESLLSLSVKVFGTPSYVATIKRGHFTPAPKVDSAILQVANINRDNFANMSANKFFALLQLGFGNKRKQLAGNLRKHFDTNLILQAFSEVGLNDKVRAEDVSLAQWLDLAIRLYGAPTIDTAAV